jgi:Zn-dependent peptidase ImmA (M78 family)
MYVAQPLSRLKIRGLACMLRDMLGVNNSREFPIMQFFEHVLPEIDPKFSFIIQPKANMRGCEGLAIPQDHLILIREDVYNNAYSGIARDRFTIAHEIGHYLMHTPDRVSFSRGHDSNYKMPSYLDPEWQANTFAAELLAPPNVIKGLTIIEIMALCKVSKKVAEIQMAG